MARFLIEWPTGVSVEVEMSDCKTVEQCINSRFGRNFDVEAHGISVTLRGEEPTPTLEPTPAPKPRAATPAKK